MEFHQLLKSVHIDATAVVTVPKDIIHETVYGIVLVVVGAILSIKNDAIQNIDGKLNSKGGVNVETEYEYLKPIEMKRAVEIVEKMGLSDYEEFDNRIEFIDIVEKRRQYNEWLNQK